MLLYGDFQPKMRTQYTAQYNLTIQRELAKDIVLQLGYVGSQGHRLLASHDINAANPQTCLGIIALANTIPAWVTDGFGTQTTCGQFAEDNSFLISPTQLHRRVDWLCRTPEMAAVIRPSFPREHRLVPWRRMESSLPACGRTLLPTAIR